MQMLTMAHKLLEVGRRAEEDGRGAEEDGGAERGRQNDGMSVISSSSNLI